MRMDKVPYVDQSGLYAMDDAIQELQDQNMTVVLTGLHGQPKSMFERFNLVPGIVPHELSFDTFKECTTWLEKHIEQDVEEHE